MDAETQKDLDVDALNARIEKDRPHWRTRWIVVQGRHLVTVALLGFFAGVAAAGLAYSIGVWMR